ncbi:MAG: endonuclease/exonuclease/phosphatase family protein [Acidobacteriaceae bacterium]|nr:endonuclease/exonuclease/phosphatase family protein [Acidobacteriaceae bacterium]
MSRFVSLACIAVVLAAAAADVDPDHPRLIEASVAPLHTGKLRIETWNIDRGTDLQTITAELERNPPDLLLLQEVDWNAARSGHADEAAQLAHTLHMRGAYAIEFEELSQETSDHTAFIGQATLARLPMKKARVLRFRHQSGFWKPRKWLPSSIPLMQRRLGSRIALVTELDLNGRTLVIYNAHLESRSYGSIQMKQIDEMLMDAKQYPEGTPILIAGDLNTKYLPTVFLKKLEDAGYHSALGEKIERTHAIAMALDWIFAKGPLQLSDGIVRKDMKGSDHYPLCALLSAR